MPSNDEADAVSDAAFAAFGVSDRGSKGSLQIRKKAFRCEIRIASDGVSFVADFDV